jgi:hypothetical protein
MSESLSAIARDTVPDTLKPVGGDAQSQQTVRGTHAGSSTLPASAARALYTFGGSHFAAQIPPKALAAARSDQILIRDEYAPEIRS